MTIKKSDLIEWYHSMTQKELLEKLGNINKAQLYRLLKQVGVEVKKRSPQRRVIVKLVD